MWEIYWIAEDLLASQEGLYVVELGQIINVNLKCTYMGEESTHTTDLLENSHKDIAFGATE